METDEVVTSRAQQAGAAAPRSAEEHELVLLHSAWWERRLTAPILNQDCAASVRLGSTPPLPRRWLARDGIRLEPAMLDAAAYQAPPWRPGGRRSRYGAVAFNAAVPYLRVPWLVGIVGCGLNVSVASESVWPEAYLPFDWYERADLGFSPRLDWLDKLLEFVAYLRDTYGDDCVPAQDNVARGPGDLVVAMLGAERFYYELYDHPDEVLMLLEQVTTLYIRWARVQLELLPCTAGGWVNQYGIWCPGPTIRFQEDYSINLSPALFERFLRPGLARVAAAFECQILHTHSAGKLAEWCLDLDGLTAIEMQFDPNGPTVAALVPRLRSILERKPMVLVGAITQEDVSLLVQELPPGGLWIDVEANASGAPGDLRRLE